MIFIFKNQMGYYVELLSFSKNVELHMSVPKHNDKNVEKMCLDMVMQALVFCTCTVVYAQI